MFGRLKLDGERGQLLPVLAMGLVAILGMASLAVDVGFWRYQQRIEQSAADSAAVAGAIRLFYPVTPAGAGTAPIEVTTAAQNASSTNGFTDDGGVGNLTVTVNSPPLSGTYVGDKTAVETIVQKKQPVFFAGIFNGQTSQNVSARAVARSIAGSNFCVYQLDPSSGLGMSPPGLVQAVNCSVFVNGSIGRGNVEANGVSYTGTAPAANLTNSSGTSIVAQLSLPQSDPCPNIPGCAYLQKTALPPSASAVNASGQSSLGPGTYKNCCAGSTLSPGIYYLYGGFSGAFSGTGVTIVNADASDITINGGGRGSMNITAPTSGPSAGIAYYQPPNLPANNYTANGNPGFYGGVFYAPQMQYTTHGKGDNFSFLLIGGTNVTGNKAIVVDPTGGPAAQQPAHVVLSE